MPALLLAYSQPILEDTFDEFRQLLASGGLAIQTENREPPGPQAGLEWLLPTAVFFFIGKSYFEGIFKEMGKNHYGLMKKGLKTLYARLIEGSSCRCSEHCWKDFRSAEVLLALFAASGGRRWPALQATDQGVCIGTGVRIHHQRLH